MSVLRTVARPLLACPFVLAGIDAFARPAGHRERAQTFAPLAKKAGMEFDETTADLATRGLGVGFALAGLALATGKCPRVAGGVLAALEVPVALANNPFWRHRGERRRADLAGLAQEYGYADQPHLSREFKRYSGTTPAAFAQARREENKS